MAQKKIGIVADNYKVAKFKIELKKAGFTKVTDKPLRPGLQSIFIKVEEADFEAAKSKIYALCQTVEAHYKQSN